MKQPEDYDGHSNPGAYQAELAEMILGHEVIMTWQGATRERVALRAELVEELAEHKRVFGDRLAPVKAETWEMLPPQSTQEPF